MVMNNFLPIVTINVNGINAPIKRYRVAECIRKHDSNICCLQENHLRTNFLYRLKVKGWKKYSKQTGREKKAGVAILISDKIDFKTKAIKRDPEGHFIILKGRMHQEDINIVNICTQHTSTRIYKQNLGRLQERYRQQHTYTRGS